MNAASTVGAQRNHPSLVYREASALGMFGKSEVVEAGDRVRLLVDHISLPPLPSPLQRIMLSWSNDTVQFSFCTECGSFDPFATMENCHQDVGWIIFKE